MFPGHLSHLHPPLNAACLGILTPSPQDEGGGDEMDGRLCPCTGSGMGLGHGEEVPGCGAGRGKVSYCSVQPHCPSHTHTRGGMQVGGSLQVSQSLPGQPLTTREGRMRHFCCCPWRGLAWRVLSCKCDADAAPPKVPGIRGYLQGQAENLGVPRGSSSSSIKGAPHPLHPGSPTPVPGQHHPSCVHVGWRCR